MRIIAGSLKGRILAETHGHRTHPMSEKIRGALFNALGDIEGLTVLDAFTGTGAVAVEAVSRGAKSVIAIDSDKEAYNCASKNVQTLGISGRIKVSQANISSWLDTNPGVEFDIVIADPPYDAVSESQLQKIADTTKLRGIFVASLPGNTEIDGLNNFEKLTVKTYGDAKLEFFRRIS